MVNKFSSDIDIDVGDRDYALSLIPHVRAVIVDGDEQRRHPSGIYVTRMPYDPKTGTATLSYEEAEQRGYLKLDLLNVSVYNSIKDYKDYETLLNTEPPWERLLDKKFCSKIIHVGNWHSVITEMPEPINSIPRMAMFLSIIRPGKKHLIGKCWREISETVWDNAGNDGGYTFKKSHAVSYSKLVSLHMNILNRER
jgi:hypothetical protein